jgi:hypothetical protein
MVQFSVLRIRMSRAVGSWLLTFDAFDDVQWGESNHLPDALHRPGEGKLISVRSIADRDSIQRLFHELAERTDKLRQYGYLIQNTRDRREDSSTRRDNLTLTTDMDSRNRRDLCRE